MIAAIPSRATVLSSATTIRGFREEIALRTALTAFRDRLEGSVVVAIKIAWKFVGRNLTRLVVRPSDKPSPDKKLFFQKNHDF